ncbi:crossover junction endonuclease EME1 isoform X2 [Orussus abietinus]|uniref:crossover junction endonuclease EME1 isoform X2 n=1 Tax=Orussus abietinus TaxID=222816 RepID=UPI000626C86B|nr:crossover junction endonuclease EME1 isoform X2 [Orussus abietinus]
MSDDVVCLSDSSDSSDSVLRCEDEEPRAIDEIYFPSARNATSDFSFPEVPFDYVLDINNREKESTRDEINTESRKNVRRSSLKPYSSEPDYHGDNEPANVMLSSSLSEHYSHESHFSTEEYPLSGNTAHAKNNKGKRTTNRSKKTGNAERAAKQQEAAKEKALKTIAIQNLKNMQPGECMKFMEVIIGEDLINEPFYSDIISKLRSSELLFTVKSQVIPRSVTWKRTAEEYYVDSDNSICTKSRVLDEDQIVVIWNWDEAVTKVANGDLCASVATMQASIDKKKLTLIIYGIEEYFKYQKSCKKKSDGNKHPEKSRNKRSSKQDNIFGRLPRISKSDLELCLTEAQLTMNCNSRLMENPENLAMMIYQYTKSIAERPLKLERKNNVEDKLDWYAKCDNRDTVQVDKEGNGLKRLWQQQLCQFHLATLETAEAISKVYGSPLQLMDAYMKCTPTEGQKLLKDIPVRRAAGPLTTARKIGPELSKKIYTMFTSEDGEALLGNE